MPVPKKYEHINFKPPTSVANEAKRGLELREEFGRGATQVGVARARDLFNRKNISPDTIKRMVSYFARHEVDKKGKGWKRGSENYPSAGKIAWLIWGGDAGRAWSNKVKKQMESADKKKSASLDITSGKEAIDKLIEFTDGMHKAAGYSEEKYEEKANSIRNEFIYYVKQLDMYLTGSDEARNYSAKEWIDLIDQYEHIFYMSDGGYTRLLVDIVENRVRLVDSTPRSKKKWDSLIMTPIVVAGEVYRKVLEDDGTVPPFPPTRQQVPKKKST